jgi:DMSO/TMAO reductase YedYZ molybdopterin-dependent catalytic subunit
MKEKEGIIMPPLYVRNMMGDEPPDCSKVSWILTIDGLVKNPLKFRWPELMELPSIERKVPLV